MRFRFATSALVFLVAMTMATGAFAQGIFTLSAGSESRGRNNGHAELAGGITLFLENGTIDTGDEGAIEIDYGVPITNAFAIGAIEVDICGDSGTTIANNVDIDADEGTITLTVNGTLGTGTPPTAAIDCTTVGEGQNSINIDGVRLSLVGSGLTSVEASINVSGDVRLGNKTATVIDSVVDPLTDEDVDVEEKVTVTRHTGELDDETQFMLVITEPHNDSFAGSQLELTFSGLPEDVNVVEVDAWVTTKKNFDRDA